VSLLEPLHRKVEEEEEEEEEEEVSDRRTNGYAALV
jgi:hypothetical protein